MQTNPADDDVAADYLRATLVPRRFGWVRAGIDALLGSNALTIYDLEVRRIDTDALIIRTPADMGDPHYLLGRVELDLETQTLTEFLEEWRPASA